MSPVTTWTDPEGMWHATVPEHFIRTDSPKGMASRAISAQMIHRGDVPAGTIVPVELVSRDSVHFHYREA